MILNLGVEKQFNVFKEAFLQVCGGRVLRLFHSQELMAVVVGNQDYDWIELEKNAQYRNGYTQDDETIKLFWEVFHEFDIDQKKKFLLFLTGSDRVPVMGMKAIKVRYIIIIIIMFFSVVIIKFYFFFRFLFSPLKMIISYQWHTRVSIF